MSFLSDVKGDVRNFFVNMLLGGIVILVTATAAALYRSLREQSVPWTILIGLSALGVILLALALWLLRKKYKSEPRETKRAAKVVSQAAKLLGKNHHMHPLHAIRAVGAADLSNHDLIQVNKAIASRGFKAPFSDAIQENDYLRFLRFFNEANLPVGTEPEIYEAAKRFYLPADDNPLIIALEELDALYAEGDHMATLFQCEGAKLPTFPEAVAWNEKAIAYAKRRIFSDHISTGDWAQFKEHWNFADCQRIERVLREHGFLKDATNSQCATFKYLWGRVKRLGELIAKIKGVPVEENKTPIESLTDFVLKVHSLLEVFACLVSPLPLAEQNDLFEKIRQFLRKKAPEYVDRFNDIVRTPPPTRIVEFPEDFTANDKEEWSRTRSEPCDRLHAMAAYLSRVISDLRSKLPS